MARKYTKRSDYWREISKKKEIQAEEATSKALGYLDISLGSDDVITRGRVGGNILTSNGSPKDRFPHISSGLLPYETGRGVVTIRDTIELCQKAYANVSIFRNTIDGMVEFSNVKIKVLAKDKRVKRFVETWLKRVEINKLQ